VGPPRGGLPSRDGEATLSKRRQGRLGHLDLDNSTWLPHCGHLDLDTWWDFPTFDHHNFEKVSPPAGGVTLPYGRSIVMYVERRMIP
jgi:hypothetical protein